MHDALTLPKGSEVITAASRTAAIDTRHHGAEIADVTLLLREDGTNRRARFGLIYELAWGPTTAFAGASPRSQPRPYPAFRRRVRGAQAARHRRRLTGAHHLSSERSPDAS